MKDRQTRMWEFIDEKGSFRLKNPHLTNTLYFPLANQARMLSAVTPLLHGDIKTDQNTFFSQPLSIEDLHNTRSARNFWVYEEDTGPWSVTGNSAAQLASRFEKQGKIVELEAGFLWHELTREHPERELKAQITNFVPAGGDQVELMRVRVTNTGSAPCRLTPTAALPIFGRSADNLRDHRHVTSLLNRITCGESGVLMKPTLSFDERGHIPNPVTYAVLGVDDKGRTPEGFFPVLEDFIGEGGTLDWPRAVVENRPSDSFPGDRIAGFEALGGLRFPEVTLDPGKSASWVLVLAILQEEGKIGEVIEVYGSVQAFDCHLERTQEHWNQLLDTLRMNTGDLRFDLWMKWVSCQPILRRLYGNSFLPYHDYGRGGRGWRDLWQDILSLLMMEPAGVEDFLLSNFAGVRMDGSNATIIGSQPGEFRADRNEIPRVWMDHGAWPWLTVKFYLDQTGEVEFLLREQGYFQDHLIRRAQGIDRSWQPEQGTALTDSRGQVYRGSVLEHILVQHLTAFFHVGEHNLIRLEGADWNDGLDMARERGESAAFTALYASNFREIAEMIQRLKPLGINRVSLAEELLLLLDSLNQTVDYTAPAEKLQRLENYFSRIEKGLSGKQVKIGLDDLAADLQRKADHLAVQLRTQEWIEDGEERGWFNGYYDNEGNRLEGRDPEGVRMTLTGQVFPLMGGVASPEQARKIVRAADAYLYDPEVGGYRLNTNFGETLLTMGRAFGFAYGHKENGAMFSHMAVMFANALYQQDLVEEGFKVLDGIYRQSVDFPTSRIYPGIPEYFNPHGRGMYPYLTGSASWYLLTMTTRVFGVRGQAGDLLLQPRLMPEQFDNQGAAEIHVHFASRKLDVCYLNPDRLSWDQVSVREIKLNGREIDFEREDSGGALLARDELRALPAKETHRMQVLLKEKRN